MREYAGQVNDPDADYWEDLARRDPYFPLFSADGRCANESDGDARDQFFATGEADLSTLLSAIDSLFARDISIGSALDFGCGAGRLTLPLARRATRVSACDVAPTMLNLARRNAEMEGLHNIDFRIAGRPGELPAGPFDFVCSLSVFRHIPATHGYALIRSLARSLAPGGIAAIQVPVSKSPRARRITPTASRLERVRAEGVDGPMNVYNGRRVAASFRAAGAQAVACFSGSGATRDTVLIFQKVLVA